MSLVDGLLAFGILGAVGWLFYRSFIKKKAGCSGCSACSCGRDSTKENNRLVRLS